MTPPQPTGTLRAEIEEILDTAEQPEGFYFAHCVDQLLELLASHMETVIGEDEEVDGIIWRTHQNRLKAEQRLRLAQLLRTGEE